MRGVRAQARLFVPSIADRSSFETKLSPFMFIQIILGESILDIIYAIVSLSRQPHSPH